jgi:hypothetical protein
MTQSKLIMVSTPIGDRNDFYEYYKKYYNQEPYPFQKIMFEYLTSDQPYMFRPFRRGGKSIVRKLYLDFLENNLKYKKDISIRELYYRPKLKRKK